MTVLLGATQAGKTSLMRLMAGLDTPTSGQVRVDGQDVTGMPVRERNVAMVYQQFINYPVADGGRQHRLAAASCAARRTSTRACARWPTSCTSACSSTACPAELSGGQQQRVALARALAKNAPLMLLDEPLVNLDYKLREGLREELTQLFASGDSTVIYATTEPGEALLLGGYTAVLDAGELLQYGPTAEVFHAPQSLRVARAFSDPPMNLLAGAVDGAGVRRMGERRAVAGAVAAGRRSQGDAHGGPARQRAATSAERARRRRLAGQGRAGRDLRLRHLRACATRRSANWSRSSPACTASSWARRSRCTSQPAQAYVFDAAGRLAGGAAPGAGRRTDMARIDLDLAHAYRANPKQESDYALLPLKMSFRDGGAYALARALGLRQDDDAQHHLGPARALAGQRHASTAATSPAPRRSSATSRRCSSSR